MKRLEERVVDTIDLVDTYISDEFYSDLLTIQSVILRKTRDVMYSKGFTEILPVIISPITDPLNHEIFDASIEYYDQKYSITKSMILHKQVSTLVHKKIFCMSPNIRLEIEDKYESGRHLYEFVQLDMEVREAKREDIMDIMEDLIIETIDYIKCNYSNLIKKYNETLEVPKKNFKKIKVKEALKKYGKDYEKILSEKEGAPFWLIDLPLLDREFYDKQNKKDPEYLLDFDLIYPKGFGEAISGGEREHEYKQILSRMRLKGNSEKSFEEYLKIAKKGLLKESAGCGLGIERFTRYILGLKHVEKARMFAKAPGKISI
ncbi:asparagine synthetase A [Oceanotoga sp. DSM 15011]|jgi:asparaginyl-tRNA synthetase|uniref:Aspartate-ammonia ligase n=1 Tax=Oceanotoga teriensis TaxID=515440 RepID=A0AA45HJJ5_9BACT|nr:MULTISPECIES: asparagine synthetase A [Oceanotoga]MDN5341215.1 asparaginyl-tRNA synthetase [Oceanotoga sp.]MDO7976895.1 asparagine synthetase A [Oceanotoga teriensis]PWJ95975.1 aspartate-ammonia ligase [Oceanotoga teriensis]UYP00802.1 asparagine synthetase A [Oceanotoga sp. DSM 15011]